ncbi:lysoplasmalogenase [Sinirhodobacter ferrireducens]|uniref:Lysoplasmalogenase n=1 Tax=Paenirhodobacter ferrireducens TaxID=1215032 RepID=A0A443LCW2_9RHOB|nr:lysoplasmalogenase [Sinirhodobacter ferrireducens]RWR46994.1 lysoplasmalogenase [Sinirhodobacter ferrireducens]
MSLLTDPLFLIAAALAALYLLRFAAAMESWPKTVTKTLSVLLLAVIALRAGAPVLLSLGLMLGALGDFCLSRPGRGMFLAGMAGFAAGHLAYLALFLVLGAGAPPLLPTLALLLGAAAAVLWIAPRAEGMVVPVRGYIVVIAAMALAALGLSGAPRLVLGALVFVASDFVLALQRFVLAPGRGAQAAAYLVWALYWPAQVLILAGGLLP